MAVTKLTPYTVQIHPNGQTDEGDYWDLTNLRQYHTTIQSELGNQNHTAQVSDIDTITDLFQAFCEYHQSNLTDLGEKTDRLDNVTLALSEDWKGSEEVVEGNLYLGNYGVIRNLVDRQSGERRERGRDLDDAEEKPLYFLLYMPPEETTEAYLILERSRRYGAKEPVHIAFRYWIREHYAGEVNVKMDPVKTDDIFPKMREADRTSRLRLEKEGTPQQLHSRFADVFDQDEMRQATEFRPVSGDDMYLIVDELQAWFSEAENAFEVIDGTSYDNVKITVEKHNSKETISLTKGETNLRKNVDLSEVSADGDIPVLSEMSKRAHGFLTTVTGGPTGTTSLFE